MPLHIDSDELERYVLGRLPPDRVEVVEDHILTCSECQRTVVDCDVFVASMRSALRRGDITSKTEGATPIDGKRNPPKR
jgi:anti-sigma factor RsiW